MRVGSRMDWKQRLAYITGSVDQELLLRNEYLVTENCILRQQITGRVRLRDGERTTGKGNVLLFPPSRQARAYASSIECRERLGGLLKSYDREAA